jgi:Protein kinase domain
MHCVALYSPLKKKEEIVMVGISKPPQFFIAPEIKPPRDTGKNVEVSISSSEQTTISALPKPPLKYLPGTAMADTLYNKVPKKLSITPQVVTKQNYKNYMPALFRKWQKKEEPKWIDLQNTIESIMLHTQWNCFLAGEATTSQKKLSDALEPLLQTISDPALLENANACIAKNSQRQRYILVDGNGKFSPKGTSLVGPVLRTDGDFFLLLPKKRSAYLQKQNKSQNQDGITLPESGHLGKGGYARVRVAVKLAEHAAEEKIVAAKIFNTSGLGGIEHAIHKKVSPSNKHIIGLLGFFQQASEAVMFLEFASGGTGANLQKKIKSSHKLSSEEKDDLNHAIARECFDAVQSLHNNDPPIYHQDIKSNNFLVIWKNGQPKIVLSDLGQSVTRKTRINPGGGFGNMPPEYNDPEASTEKGDLYCLGVTLRKLVRDSSSPRSRELLDIAARLMHYDPAQRPSLNEIQEENYFKHPILSREGMGTLIKKL